MSAISLFAVLAVVTDTLCPQVMAPVEAADVHVRCRVPWKLEWRDAASGEARCLAIDVSHDNIYGDKASVEYVAGTDSVLARWNIDAKDASGPVSLRIAKDLYGTHLYAVNGEELTLDGGDTDIDLRWAVQSLHDTTVGYGPWWHALRLYIALSHTNTG